MVVVYDLSGQNLSGQATATKIASTLFQIINKVKDKSFIINIYLNRFSTSDLFNGPKCCFDALCECSNLEFINICGNYAASVDSKDYFQQANEKTLSKLIWIMPKNMDGPWDNLVRNQKQSDEQRVGIIEAAHLLCHGYYPELFTTMNLNHPSHLFWLPPSITLQVCHLTEQQ